MKTFIGHPDADGFGGDVVVEEDNKTALLNPRTDLRNHSPTGFAWGYGGSGPSQLALALSASVLDDEAALRRYQELKWQFVARIPKGKKWSLTEEELREMLAE